ncbi:hypothetical protein GWR56_12980 [Mucilaginibacter sp. 14171R-50]|uniref:hypothetical protein n=1 Tax=Mucilaginibacter sp. 14171R-50 TaxID=2703789 RepID=UPI00138D072B|nr:hypothetical protein [Mucilaginibacter sp. 14171R-50]QHS56407.1 hypothetical protein GWR56_12980 [Mucilaginibacter sp. 14171R-50]
MQINNGHYHKRHACASVGAGMEIDKISVMKAPEFADGGFSDEDPAGYVGQATIFKKSASRRPLLPVRPAANELHQTGCCKTRARLIS